MSPHRIALKDLLATLDAVRDEDVQATTVTGLACSRTSDDLHLAVGGGVLAIPIEDIEEVSNVSIDNPRHVSVRVKRPESLRFLRRPPALSSIERRETDVRQATSLRAAVGVLRNSDDIVWPPILGPGVATQYCVTTVTDGNACDDFECESFPDDLRQ